MLRSLVSSALRVPQRSFALSSLAKAEAKPSQAEVNELFKDENTQRRHAYSVNRVELIGGVADTPRKLVAKNGRDFAIFSVITNSSIRLPSGEYVDQPERHSVTAFGRLAEVVERNVDKGTRVLVHGRLHHSGGLLKEDGTRTPRQTHIHAENVTPLAKARQA